MRIYLAGALRGGEADWRSALLQQPDGSAPTLLLPSGHTQGRHFAAWPQTPNAWVLGEHEYVGPYWRDCCLGYPQEHCAAVARADLVFAWVGQSVIHEVEDAAGRTMGRVDDAFLTDTMLGYARGLGKHIFVVGYEAERAEANWRGWFLGCQLADADAHVCHDHEQAPDFALFLRRALRSYQRACPRPAPVHDFREVRDAFANIVKWTSDPRVRHEARGMLQRLAVRVGPECGPGTERRIERGQGAGR